MVDIKIMKEIEEKSKEAVKYMTALQAMEKRNMTCDVYTVMRLMEAYDDLCNEIRKLINEN